MRLEDERGDLRGLFRAVSRARSLHFVSRDFSMTEQRRADYTPLLIFDLFDQVATAWGGVNRPLPDRKHLLMPLAVSYWETPLNCRS